MAPKKGLYNLNRPKLRQSWNKYNLYNIWRQREPYIGRGDLTSETFFQQKWRARGLLRAYHGEHIRERDWIRMFSRRLLSVANMSPKYMAKNDGSELAAGRGSGEDMNGEMWDAPEVKPARITPYMNMAFAPMERRLDIAVFRAMFASSARQARQFCLHGAVKVNGKVMRHAMYKLNPGDMFQVDPDRVMYATGPPKPKGGRDQRSNAKLKAVRKQEEKERAKANAAKKAEQAKANAAETKVKHQETTTEPREAQVPKLEELPDTTDEPEVIIDMKPTRKEIQAVLKRAKDTLNATASKKTLGVSHRRALRQFVKDAKQLLSKSGRDVADLDDITEELSKLLGELSLKGASLTPSDSGFTPGALPETQAEASSENADGLTEDERQILAKLVREEEKQAHERKENPIDRTKPYPTPWQPRPYMSPFAFIPRYLEVNQNICSAVYLRHPVARLDGAEVPTPFGYRVQQLAYNWYLRRR